MQRVSSKLCAIAALISAAGAAYAGPAIPTVVYSDIITSPTSDVPGLAGAKFSSFDRIYVSPDGSRWIMSADTDLATTMDEVIVAGMVGAGSGSVAVQEGTPSGFAPGENIGLIDRNLQITNNGDFVFATNTDGPTTSDEYIARYDANLNMFFVVGREGDPVPGIAGETYGISLHAGTLDSLGRSGFVAPSTNGGQPTTSDDFIIFNGAVVAQSGVTVPAGQGGGGTATWELFDFEDHYRDAGGNNYLIQGDLTGTVNDDVLVYNGNVVIQEGFTFDILTDPVDLNGILDSKMDPGGDWWARGDDSTQRDWLARNGSIIAQTGDTVPGGLAGETFSDALFSATFFSMVSNGVGDYVYGATTSNADPLADAVLVFNNLSVIARQGDPVDVDGNGLFDDNAFINVFNNDDAFLTDGLEYWFTADLMDSAGLGIGQAVIRLQIPAPGAAGLLALGGLAALRRRR